jgi:O-antigen/teichoic acid export membrane protein
MKKSVAKNSVYSLIKAFGQVIFPLITFPYITRVLMTENVGKINFSTSIISYIGLIASLGISTYAIRECSRIRNDLTKLSITASEIFSINIITTFIAYALLVVLLLSAPVLFNYRVLICLLSVNILFTCLGADWLNTAMEDFRYITVRTFSFQLLSLLAMLLFVHKPADYYKYALITVLSSSGANILNIFYRSKFCKIQFTFKINLKQHIIPIITLFAMLLSQSIFCNSDITILGIIKGDYEVGLYSVSVKIYNLVNSIIASIAWVIMPQMSYYFSQNNYTEINKLFRYAANFILTIGLPCIAGLNILSEEIIVFISGKEYLGATRSLNVLTIALAISLANGLLGNIILLPSMKEKICLRACIYAAVVNIILNILFIPKYSLNAAAVTTAISQLIILWISVIHMDKKVRLFRIRNLLFGPIVGVGGVVAICLLAKILISNLLLKLCIAIGLSLVIYPISLLIFKNEIACNIATAILNKTIKKKH